MDSIDPQSQSERNYGHPVFTDSVDSQLGLLRGKAIGSQGNEWAQLEAQTGGESGLQCDRRHDKHQMTPEWIDGITESRRISGEWIVRRIGLRPNAAERQKKRIEPR